MENMEGNKVLSNQAWPWYLSWTVSSKNLFQSYLPGRSSALKKSGRECMRVSSEEIRQRMYAQQVRVLSAMADPNSDRLDTNFQWFSTLAFLSLLSRDS